MTKPTLVTVAAAAALALASWFFRYDVMPLSSHAAAYKLDRWTGTVYFVAADKESPVAPF